MSDRNHGIMRFFMDTIQNFHHFTQTFVVLPDRRLVQNKNLRGCRNDCGDRGSALLSLGERLRVTVIQMFDPELLRDPVCVFGRCRAEFYLPFDRRHEELVVGILIHDADLFVPCLAGSALLTEALVYILPYNAACWLFEP